MGTLQLEDGREDPRGKDARYSDKISKEFLKRGHDFIPTQFIIDDDYIGEPPRVQVSFENINDNIDEKFLNSEISKIGKFSKLQIVRGPSGEHLGLAKVQFYTPEIAERCVQYYHGKSLMGRKLVVELDVRFENIERKKERALRPVVRPIKPPELIESVQTPIPVPILPPTPVPSTPQLDADRPTNRQHAPGSLLERLALLGLAKSGFPSNNQPLLQPIQNNSIAPRPPPRPSNLISRHDKKPLIEQTPPPKHALEEDVDAWNPPIPSSPVEEKVYLTIEEIEEISIPYVIEEYLKDLERNLRTTSRLRILRTSGYPCLDKHSSEYKAEQDRKEFEKRRKEQVKQNEEREDMAILQATHKRFLGRQENINNEKRNSGQVVRHRTGANESIHNMGRLNRSSAYVDDKRGQNDRRGSSGSTEDSLSPRLSRPRDRTRLSSESGSGSSRSSSSSSSISVASDTTSETSSSSSSTSSHNRESSPFEIEVESSGVPTKPAWHVDNKEETAASALLDLKRQPNQLEKLEEPKTQLTTKKRKTKLSGQENRAEKRAKIEYESYNHVLSSQEKKSKILVKGPRSAEKIRQLENDLTITDEDLEYLKKVHDRYEDEHSSNERTRIPFGSDTVNGAHLYFRKYVFPPVASKKKKSPPPPPEWWNGCSRCSLIPHETEGWKGQVRASDDDEDDDDEEEKEVDGEGEGESKGKGKGELKASKPKSTNSVRRNQRSDQRRLLTANPDIDPAFLKHLTSSTLQMRAKNLRFSRSAIHMWGLFACENIANGEAVIEYVGEKIRPSVADHRETEVYPKMSAHDGSSYFFRVDNEVIDAAFKGNKARFINHSCNPNCIAKVIRNENGSNSIVIYAKRAIEEDEEITYDYKFPREDGENKILCRCTAPNCKKYLN